MNEKEFWDIIEESSKGTRGSQDAHEAGLKKILTKMEAAEVISFDRIFSELVIKAYTWDLWGAAFIIDGGCSDDGFEYFRYGLIASGRQKFEAALRDPETLADWAEPDEVGFEGFKYAIHDVIEKKSGKDAPSHGLKQPSRPGGEKWHEDGDELEERFPKLWERFAA